MSASRARMGKPGHTVGKGGSVKVDSFLVGRFGSNRRSWAALAAQAPHPKSRPGITDPGYSGGIVANRAASR